jgi:hypothetical protein
MFGGRAVENNFIWKISWIILRIFMKSILRPLCWWVICHLLTYIGCGARWKPFANLILWSRILFENRYTCAHIYIFLTTLSNFMRTVLLLYGDDDILGTYEKSLQHNLNVFYEFWAPWKLNINFTKTKDFGPIKILSRHISTLISCSGSCRRSPWTGDRPNRTDREWKEGVTW